MPGRKSARQAVDRAVAASWETPEDAATLVRSAMKDWSVELCQQQRERFRELYSQEKLERDLVSVIRDSGFIDR